MYILPYHINLNRFNINPNGIISKWPQYGTGADGSLTVIANTTTSLSNAANMKVVNFDNLTIETGATLTVANPCQGLVIYVKNNLILNGTINMTARGYGTPSLPVGSYPVYLYLAKRAGIFARLEKYERVFQEILYYAESGCITNGGASNAPGSNGSIIGACGGGGGGNSWNSYGGAGGAGYFFSGGSGGGGAGANYDHGYDATNYGRNGGAGASYAGGGAGNPGVSGGGTGTGGLLIVIAYKILGGGVLRSNGVAGGYGAAGGGGGSGGGAIILRAEKHLSTVTCNSNGGSGGANGGGAGGAGHISIM